MMKSMLQCAATVAACLCFSSTASAQDGWEITITPAPQSTPAMPSQPVQADNAELPKINPVSTKTETTKIEIEVHVKQDSGRCSRPRYPYGTRLPRISADYSYYFPWRNYRRYDNGFYTQYRPRTIYNYGWTR